MAEKRFSMTGAVSFGWDTMKANIWFFIALLITAGLIENIPGAIGRFAIRDFPFAGIALYMAGWFLGFMVQMGLIKVGLKFCDKTKGSLDDLLSSFDLLLTFIASTLLYFLIVLGGLILLIVPGVVWAVRFSLYPYFIVDRGLGPIEAIKASGTATEGAKLDLFLFGGLMGLINLAGALCFLVGLFATVPASLVAYAYVYRQLAGEGEPVISAPEAPPGSTPDMAQKSPMYIKLEA